MTLHLCAVCNNRMDYKLTIKIESIYNNIGIADQTLIHADCNLCSKHLAERISSLSELAKQLQQQIDIEKKGGEDRRRLYKDGQVQNQNIKIDSHGKMI